MKNNMYTFTKDLETGNAAIDAQHRELIHAVNRLLEACSEGNGRMQVKQTAHFLFDYTKRHFTDEEALQVAADYPDYPNHKRYHEAFKETVVALVEELETQEVNIAMVGKINRVVAGWLINHIKREDVRMAQYIRGLNA